MSPVAANCGYIPEVTCEMSKCRFLAPCPGFLSLYLQGWGPRIISKTIAQVILNGVKQSPARQTGLCD